MAHLYFCRGVSSLTPRSMTQKGRNYEHFRFSPALVKVIWSRSIIYLFYRRRFEARLAVARVHRSLAVLHHHKPRFGPKPVVGFVGSVYPNFESIHPSPLLISKIPNRP